MNQVTRRADQIRFALAHPGLAIRRLRGLSVIEISVDEIANYVPSAYMIVEAGALDGTDTVKLSTRWPEATVHAFEPVPSSFLLAQKNTSHLPNVRCHQIALSDTNGRSIMYISSAANGEYRPDSSSLLKPTGHLREIPAITFSQQVSIQTQNLDSWALDHGVSTIDLLWLDLQGFEMKVIRTAPRILHSTRAVLMEVSRRELFEGSELYPEVIALMTSIGFSLVIDRVSRNFGNALFVRR